MPSVDSLIKSLVNEFGHITFTEAADFSWDPSTHTIFFNRIDDHAAERLLHEVAHAELDHRSYERDIDLIGLERDAWHLARTKLSDMYELSIDAEVVENHMDTYRDWLHARSTCPSCSATGIQTGNKEYTCLACRTKWRVNDAKVCELRRYKKNTPK